AAEAGWKTPPAAKGSAGPHNAAGARRSPGRRHSSTPFGSLPPPSEGDQRPHRLHHPERPGALGESIDRRKHTRACESQHVSAAALFQGVAHHHRGHCNHAEHRESIHSVLITQTNAPCKCSSPASPTSSPTSPPMCSVPASARSPT